ncbi:MAG: PQQ-binding-like beta-propeller repeat protein [Candidatus Aenigmarchaeota archaeon]|nr:PQQ-binding-like beta-propeller repeat protein [Candidatus Aenigmarchaeota archaeon]
MPSIDFKKIGEGGGIFCRSAIKDDVLYFGSFDKYFYAIDAKTGHEIWNLLADGIIMSSPVIENNIIYFGCFDKCLYAISIEKRDILWKKRTEGIIVTTPTINNGVIYFGSCDGYLYASSTKTGDILWRFKTENEIVGDVVVDNNRIYFGSTDHNLYCLEPNGSLVWKFRANGEFLVRAPVIKDNIIYAAASDGCVYAIDKNIGVLLWKFQSSEESFNSLSLDKKTLYFGSKDRYLYAIDAKTGTLLWKFRANQGIGTAPTISEYRIFFGADMLYALDKKGALLWTFGASSEDELSFVHSPSIYNSKLYFSSFDGYFRCIGLDGYLIWAFRTKSNKKIKIESGAIKPASWWDEKMFLVFEDANETFAPKEPYAVCARYGVDVITNLEDVIEQNRYTDMGAPEAYKALENKKYINAPGSYVEKTNTAEKDTKKWKDVFGIKY